MLVSNSFLYIILIMVIMIQVIMVIVIIIIMIIFFNADYILSFSSLVMMGKIRKNMHVNQNEAMQ